MVSAFGVPVVDFKKLNHYLSDHYLSSTDFKLNKNFQGTCCMSAHPKCTKSKTYLLCRNCIYSARQYNTFVKMALKYWSKT